LAEGFSSLSIGRIVATARATINADFFKFCHEICVALDGGRVKKVAPLSPRNGIWSGFSVILGANRQIPASCKGQLLARQGKTG